MAQLEGIAHIPGLPSSTQLILAANLLDQTNRDSLWAFTYAVDLYTNYTLSNPVFKVNWDFFRAFPTEQSILDVVTSSERKRELNITQIIAGIIFQVCTRSFCEHLFISVYFRTYLTQQRYPLYLPTRSG